MASAAVAVQDDRGGPRLSMVRDVVDEASLITRLHDDTDPLENKQFSCRNGYHPKVRKPYTITKQRERWTNEEHNKFLEALKLYGRAWRHIEEHIGTKTAVQIRSHAQKFFSKVERESGGDTTAMVDPIEIPPPRPKRRPTHPYPRKMVVPLNKDALTLKQPIRSSSPDSPPSELETQSPTSVLSAVSADRSDSMTSNRSLSPASRDVGLQSVKVLSEPFSSSEDSSSLTANPQMSSAPYETLLTDDPGKEKCTRSLKLFGTTVLLTEYPPSPQTGETSKVVQDAREKRTTFQLVRTNVNMWADFAHVNLQVSDRLPIQKEVSKQVGTLRGFVNTELLLALEPGNWEEKPSPEKRTRGFVPYKKRMAARDDQCSTATGDKREEKRISLWL